jgi:hypothetical protein
MLVDEKPCWWSSWTWSAGSPGTISASRISLIGAMSFRDHGAAADVAYNAKDDTFTGTLRYPRAPTFRSSGGGQVQRPRQRRQACGKIDHTF